MSWLYQTLSRLTITAVVILRRICHGAAIFEDGGSQVFKAVYLFKPYFIYVDICFDFANDDDFTFVSVGLHSISI